MTVTDHGFLTARPPLRRRIADHVATAGMVGAALVALLVLLLVVGYLVQRGASAISWEFLTEDIPRNSRAVGGGEGQRPVIAGPARSSGRWGRPCGRG